MAAAAHDPAEQWRVLHPVPWQLRENKKNIFDAVVLPLGLYHDQHRYRFRLGVDQLKEEARDIVCGAKYQSLLLTEISKRLDDIRHFYSPRCDHHVYGDEVLGKMMLRDACFVLCYIQMVPEQTSSEFKSILLRRLGMSGDLFVHRDLFMLENQIPLWLIKLIFCLTYDGDGDKDVKFRAVLCKYLSHNHFGGDRMTRLPWEDKEEEEPLHLLEAIHRISLQADEKTVAVLVNDQREEGRSKMASIPFRSVTDLKSKGIHFGPSSHCLKDIRFVSFPLYMKLQLPILRVTNNSYVYFSNVIAFEMSPDTATNFGVTSYINFMKTLIEKEKDVKELREKGIVYSELANDEEVVRMFKSIETYGFRNRDLFEDVQMRIEKHCKSKAKTWMAELFHTKFRTPWTTAALFAAIFILCLTFLQTYYTINPTN